MPSISSVLSWLGRCGPRADRRRYTPRVDELEPRCLLTGPSVPLHLDFGLPNSPVAPGYIGVSLVTYNSTLGYGWADISNLGTRDRHISDPLLTDFIFGTDGTFLVNLPNGAYDVTTILGDATAEHDLDTVWAQGQLVVPSVTTAPGQFIKPTFKAQVTNGLLVLRFVDLGGHNPYWAVPGLDIVAAPVANAGPSVTTQEGNSVTFQGSASGGAGALSYSWNFGDGTTANGSLTPTHLYQHVGTYTGTLTVTDALGIASQASTQITIDNVPPANLKLALTAGSINEGGTTILSGSFTDPGQQDTHTVVVNWGDGSPTTTVNLGAGVVTFGGLTHQYLDNPGGQPNGSFPVQVTVTDQDGGQTSAVTPIQVNNVAPTASVGGQYAGSVGTPLTFQSTVSDPSPIDTAAGFTYAWSFGDGGTGSGPKPSHTYTAPGTYNVTLIVFDKDGGTAFVSTTATEEIGPTVVINPAWLAQHGAGPYLLDQANTTYVLTTDVDTLGTAFVVGAAGVTLDLNGHTVVYGDASPVQVTNGGFEQGSGKTVPGWDLSGAPQAVLAPNPGTLWGNQVLQLTNFSTTQTILSDPITIPHAGHSYAAVITPAFGNAQTIVTLSVIDALTGQVLGKGSSANPQRGFSAVTQFTASNTDPVRLQVTVTPPAGQSDTLDLDYAAVSASFDRGIMATQAWSGDIPGWSNLPPTVYPSYLLAANFTVRNGHINQGQGNGYDSSPLYCPSLPGLTVTNVQTLATGMDTASLVANNDSGGVTVSGSIFQQNIDNISNRMNDYASLALSQINGPIQISGNQVLNCPQIGINVGFNNPQYTVVIQNNLIEPNTVVANGYALVVAGLQNFTIANNTILASNGRGIDVDGWSSTPITNGQIYGNYVSVQEHGNREDSNAATDARALRLRNDVEYMGAETNLQIYNNTFIATTGAGFATAAYAVSISYMNPNGEMNNANVVLANNTLKAILTTTAAGYRAEALLIDGVEPGINLVCANNVLESNDVSLALCGGDLGNVYDVSLISNTVRKSSDGAVRPYTSILAGYWFYQIQDVQIIDLRTANGATPAITWFGWGMKNISVGWLLSVTAVNAAGTPLSGATVSVFDNTSTMVFTGTTGSDGQVANIPLIATVYSQLGTDPTQILTNPHGPFVVHVSDGSLNGLQVVNLTGDTAITVTLT